MRWLDWNKWFSQNILMWSYHNTIRHHDRGSDLIGQHIATNQKIRQMAHLAGTEILSCTTSPTSEVPNNMLICSEPQQLIPPQKTKKKLIKKDQLLISWWSWYQLFSILWIWDRLPGDSWYIIGCSIIRAIDCTSLFLPANEWMDAVKDLVWFRTSLRQF